MSTTANPAPETSLVPQAPKQKITTQVLAQIDALRTKGNLQLPADYSAGNALNAAWLALQEVANNKKEPIFVNGQLSNIVTQVSVANALLDMVIQGLNPAKKQGYFIVYGDKLIWQRSYFGEQALAERVKPGIEIYSAVVYEGDEFEFEVIRGRTVVTKHKQSLDTKNKPIKAAYCGMHDTATGEDLGAEVMTMERILKSWGMSKTAHFDGSTHKKFPDEMALRTVIRRRCKPIINASSDALLMESIKRQDQEQAEGEMAFEVQENANRQMLAMPAPASEEAPTEQEALDEGTPGDPGGTGQQPF